MDKRRSRLQVSKLTLLVKKKGNHQEVEKIGRRDMERKVAKNS